MERLRIGADPTICIYLNFEVRFVIDRTLFQSSFDFFATIFEVRCANMTAPQHTARPGITGISVGSGKLALRMVEVLMEDLSIALDL